MLFRAALSLTLAHLSSLISKHILLSTLNSSSVRELGVYTHYICLCCAFYLQYFPPFFLTNITSEGKPSLDCLVRIITP